MSIDEFFRISVNIVDGKFIPILRRWEWGVRKDGRNDWVVWIISNPQGNLFARFLVHKYPQAVRLSASRQGDFLFPIYCYGQEPIQSVENYFKLATEKIVVFFTYGEVSAKWVDEGNCLATYKDGYATAVKFSMERKSWSWKIFQRELGGNGRYIEWEVFSIRRRHSINPVEIFKQIIEPYEVLSSL